MRPWTLCVCLAAAISIAQPAMLEAQVQGRIRRVGLFGGNAPLVRAGNWCFVEVELRTQSSAPFAGELRVEQLDRDGDVVTSVAGVALAPEGPWRPYECYFVPNLSGDSAEVPVKLFDAQGRLVRMLTDTGEAVSELTSPALSSLSSEELLIVDLTTPSKLPHVAVLDSRKKRAAGDYTNLRTVRGLSPRELPTRWEGLEPVDAIVWDDADPSALNHQQVEALTDWVRHGGRLLISAGRNWQVLAGSELASVLPVAITGVSQQREALEFLDILDDAIYEGRLARRYNRHPILRCRMTRLPEMIGIPAQCPNPQIAYRNLLGRGSLTFVGASLRQLLPAPKHPTDSAEVAPGQTPERDDAPSDFERICERVIGWLFLGLPKVREEPSGFVRFNPVNLFDVVRQSIGFQTLSAAFLIFAVLFAAAYVLTATVGSYWYLKRRAWEHHCWSAFGVVSLGGVLVGTGMVWTLRGVTTKLWQTTVIDAKAGEDYGYGTCLFGVKTPDHTRLDLRLPVGLGRVGGLQRFGPMRVMPPSSAVDAVHTRYVAPDTFESIRSGELLKGVPVRATLKEFEGRWDGPLGGTLEARLVAHNGEAGRFGKGSYIRNHLGVNLSGCYILEDAAEVAGAGPTVTTRCLLLGALPASGPGAELDAKALQQRLYYAPASSPTAAPRLLPNRKLFLTEVVKGWQSEVRRLTQLTGTVGGKAGDSALTTSQEYASLLLLSVYDLLEASSPGQRTLRRSYGRSLSCTKQVTRSTAVLVGYTEQPPPAALEANRTNLFPQKSRTMYRFVIPVERP